MDNYECTICGEPDNYAHYSSLGREYAIMKERKVCFSCAFWLDKVDNKADPNQVVINGNMYHIGQELPLGRPDWRGYGGARFLIEWLGSDKVVETTNLWDNGTVPAHFRKELPDNAIFRAR